WEKAVPVQLSHKPDFLQALHPGPNGAQATALLRSAPPSGSMDFAGLWKPTEVNSVEVAFREANGDWSAELSFIDNNAKKRSPFRFEKIEAQPGILIVPLNAH